MEKKLLTSPDIYSGTKTYLFAVLFNLLAQLIITAIALGVQASNPSFVDTLSVVGMLIIQACVSVALILHFKSGVGVGKIQAQWLTIVVCAIIGVLPIFAFAIVTGGFECLLTLIGYKGNSVIYLDAFGVALFFLASVIVAPIIEETVFRGCLFRGIKSRFGSTWAVIISAVAFALVHMSPSQTAFQLCLGVVLGLIVNSTDSILPAIVTHSASNLTAVVLSFVSFEPATIAVSSNTGIIVFSLLFVVGVVGLIFMPKLLAKTENISAIEKSQNEKSADKVEQKAKTKVGISMLSLGLLLCLIIWISNLFA